MNYISPSRRGACTECGKIMQLGRTSAAEPRCIECRRQNPKPRHKAGPHSITEWVCVGCGTTCSRPPTKGQPPKWCSEECRHRKRQESRQRPPCGWCGVVHDLRPDRRMLDTEGQAHAQWARHYAPSTSTAVALIQRERVRWRSRFEPLVPAKPWWRIIVQGDCAWCGESFTALSTTGAARYCSDGCATRAARSVHRRQRGRFTVSLRRRRRLHERDRWTCGICGEPTTRTFGLGDPWSPTLDHVEPQAHALIPDHSDANLRTAHALCNSLRGDGRLTDAEVRELVAERRRADVPA